MSRALPVSRRKQILASGTSGKQRMGLMFENSENVASVFRSAGNRSRIEIMFLTMKGKGEFSQLMQATALSKTALANHLALLVKMGLLTKQSRGTYATTPEGRRLLNTVRSICKSSKMQVRSEEFRKRYLAAYGVETLFERHVISRMARYQSSQLSLLGALAGSLTAAGTPYTVADIGGISGYAFLVNVAKGKLCPSGPTSIHPRTFAKILTGLGNTGWKIERFELPRSYPAGSNGPSTEDLSLAMELFARVRSYLDRSDLPAVVWGLGGPEYGIVNGYEGGSYIVSTFRGFLRPRVQDDPVPFYALNAPGRLEALFLKGRTSARRKAWKSPLINALQFAEGDIPVQRGYVAGPEAFEEWADLLAGASDSAVDYMANSYLGACVREGRAICGGYLKRLSKQASAAGARHLDAAGVAYMKGARWMSRFMKLFPFAPTGKLPASRRREGVRILRKARAREEEAIKLMRRAL